MKPSEYSERHLILSAVQKLQCEKPQANVTKLQQKIFT